MANNPWPGGFFAFMFFVPLFLSYVFSAYSLYASVVVFKLILFFFTLLTALLLYSITKKVKPSYADAVLIFTLINPAILYINYIWAQVDILPVFFFTLSYFLLRYVDFGSSLIKKYLIGFFPLIISAFIYRYSLILIPALIIFESSTLKQKILASLFAVGESAALFGVEIIFFRGGLYNYVGALSGSVINNSAVEGFQYWFTIPQLSYIIFLLILGIGIPILFRKLRYSESVTLFFILLLFIYTSAASLANNYLWLYPIGVFVAIASGSKLSFNRKLLLTSLPTYVALFFINLIIGNGAQAGPFYFAYSIFHQNIVFLTSVQEYSKCVLLFNIFLLGSVILTELFCIGGFDRGKMVAKPSSEGSLVNLKYWKLAASRTKKMILAIVIILVVLAGFAFNEEYSQPIIVSSKQNFPLELFPSANVFDSEPMQGTYYLSNNCSVVFYNQSEPIAFQHPLNLQNINISLSFNVQTDRDGQYELLKTNSVIIGINVTEANSDTSAAKTQVERSFFLVNESGNTVEVPLNSSELDLNLLTTSEYSEMQVGNYSYTSTIPTSIYFGKLTAGDYGLSVALNYMVITQKTSGFYFIPVYFAVVTPFLVAVTTLYFLHKKWKVND